MVKDFSSEKKTEIDGNYIELNQNILNLLKQDFDLSNLEKFLENPTLENERVLNGELKPMSEDKEKKLNTLLNIYNSIEPTKKQ